MNDGRAAIWRPQTNFNVYSKFCVYSKSKETLDGNELETSQLPRLKFWVAVDGSRIASFIDPTLSGAQNYTDCDNSSIILPLQIDYVTSDQVFSVGKTPSRVDTSNKFSADAMRIYLMIACHKWLQDLKMIYSRLQSQPDQALNDEPGIAAFAVVLKNQHIMVRPCLPVSIETITTLQQASKAQVIFSNWKKNLKRLK